MDDYDDDDKDDKDDNGYVEVMFDVDDDDDG